MITLELVSRCYIHILTTIQNNPEWFEHLRPDISRDDDEFVSVCVNPSNSIYFAINILLSDEVLSMYTDVEENNESLIILDTDKSKDSICLYFPKDTSMPSEDSKKEFKDFIKESLYEALCRLLSRVHFYILHPLSLVDPTRQIMPSPKYYNDYREKLSGS